MTGPEMPYDKINATVPHSARVWNYWLGGKDNFAADRELGEKVKQLFPSIVEVALASRAFLGRAIRYLVEDAGVRQFLDVGTGLPTANNTHEVAQRLAPESRIVYVDNDPLVLVHARALLVSSPQGSTDYLDADVHDPDRILDGARQTLDFQRPIALMMLGILGHVADYEDARGIVTTLMDALPSGSYIVINDGTNIYQTEQRNAATEVIETEGPAYYPRSHEQIEGFFAGLELVEPGVVSTPLWRPDAGETPKEIDVLAGVGRKP